MNRTIVLAALLSFAAGGFAALAQRPELPKLVWESRCFTTYDGMVAALNKMEEAQAEAAKIVTIPSSRNVLGFAGDPYCLVYQK